MVILIVFIAVTSCSMLTHRLLSCMLKWKAKAIQFHQSGDDIPVELALNIAVFNIVVDIKWWLEFAHVKILLQYHTVPNFRDLKFS